ncbi:MAG: hypothetical protein HFH10_12735 [Dorea sp.]|nr:hypothetical protein [Dorea sp.]
MQEESFVRHQPCGDRIVFALALDRKKMKERIMVGKADQIFRGISENMDAELLCDMTRPLGTFLTDFENDMQGDWNRSGIMPLYDALHVNRWKQPPLEQQAGDFLRGKYAAPDPVRQYVAVRIWNEYLKTREYRERDAASERFVGRMRRLTAAFQSPVFQGRDQALFDEDTGKARHLELSADFFTQVLMEDSRIELWYPCGENPQTECAAVYDSFYPMIIYYANRLADWKLKFCKCKVCGKIFLAESLRYELCSGKCRKAQALQNKREFDARARENNYDLLYKNECQSWRNKIRRAERTEGFPADRRLKMQEAFDVFKKAALQKKKLVKEHKMLPQEFMDWLYQQSNVIVELTKDRSEL